MIKYNKIYKQINYYLIDKEKMFLQKLKHYQVSLALMVM